MLPLKSRAPRGNTQRLFESTPFLRRKPNDKKEPPATISSGYPTKQTTPHGATEPPRAEQSRMQTSDYARRYGPEHFVTQVKNKIKNDFLVAGSSQTCRLHF
jgi:hypothetical protein